MIFLILLFTLFPFNGGINLTYIVKKDKIKILPSCIAEEFERYEAVGWVYPIPNEEQRIPNITTKFIPTINSDYNCKFSKNNICSTKWILRDWTIDDNSARTKEFITDYRWEDLQPILISNTTKEFEERIEIDNVFKSGISVRANGIIELLVCSGWNPYNHPCYHFHIDKTEIYLNKYSALPQDLKNVNLTYLEQYKAFSNIFSNDEWRNFVVSFDANRTIKLIDVNLNRTVIKHVDEGNFSPMYLLVRSNETSLWKFHKNEFFFTNTTQTSRLGPMLTLHNKDLCISLLLSVCENCEIVFFYMHQKQRKVLKTVGHLQNVRWMEIKIKEENILSDKLNLFVETKFKNPEIKSDGFWGIDNVRVCNENEVKVSYLKLNDMDLDDEKEDYVSCQLIKMPSWRPRRLVYNKIKDFPEITAVSNSTSIKLSWPEEDTRNEINYFIMYQANDVCTTEPYSARRLKSSGFLTTKYNEVIINNLVPFTLYNITVSTVLHEVDKQVYVNTLETEEPTFKELPQKIQLRASDSTIYVSWEKVPCTEIYGKLIYTLTINNAVLNFTKRVSSQTVTSYEINGLQPYTPYSLNIVTARNAANIHKGVHTNTMVLNFTTLPGVAPPIENLELYSIDHNSSSLRYDLPKNLNGKPSKIQLYRCITTSHSKCKSYIFQVKKCPLWPKKFCVYVYNLMPSQQYSFRASLKYENSDSFGNEVSVSGYTVDRVPGAPTNVTYKVVDCHLSTDYCHLNVTWLHPYKENGTITSFNIILNSTKKDAISEVTEHIHEVYKVENKSYSPKYTHQIKYLPYSASYILYLQSVNTMYKSGFTETMIKTDDLGDHINQSPKLLEKTDHSLSFKLPYLDRRLDSYNLTTIVQDFDSKKDIEPQFLKDKLIRDNLCHKFGNTWISHVLKVEKNSTETLTIDSSEKGKIKPKTKYCVTFIITNNYKGAEHNVVYYEKLETPIAPPVKESNSSNNHLYILLLLLLLIPAGFFIYRCLRKRRVISKPAENNENVYESLPFEECESNCVSNENYDQLIHK
ncbi:uncharacterized protein LOC108904723 [Anoplophora glabripennis]|uniref:uncharacterized protein LOC108904723 n=1 Tax=Anoplophora glabripennis TaxID=217634 RepID=UPI00087554CE|nr:uncharacterized protein LOC108904723 [Anoplophora glabripennis]